jgi:hypothetical protein
VPLALAQAVLSSLRYLGHVWPPVVVLLGGLVAFAAIELVLLRRGRDGRSSPHLALVGGCGHGSCDRADVGDGRSSIRPRDVRAVREGLAQFWQSFDTLEHDELNVYGTDRNLAHEALNHYTTADRRKVTIRAVAWIDRDDDGQITSIRIYNDQSPPFGTSFPGASP